jgi:hypothetical protein
LAGEDVPVGLCIQSARLRVPDRTYEHRVDSKHVYLYGVRSIGVINIHWKRNFLSKIPVLKDTLQIFLSLNARKEAT